VTHIRLDKVTVDFPVYDTGHRSVRRSLLTMGVGGAISRHGRNQLVVRALDGIDLDLRKGDRVGLIGHNGSGKSTLLQVLAGIREPTGGMARIDGSTAALLSLGSILDPEMTGYENIGHAGVLLSIPNRRRDPFREDIAAFTELGSFLDLPVRTYSAGMRLRLSFALMTAQEAEILLLDEAFGAGDAHFQERAARRMAGLSERMNITVFASHDSAEIRRFCNKAVWLEHGRVRQVGPVDPVLTAYLNLAPAGI